MAFSPADPSGLCARIGQPDGRHPHPRTIGPFRDGVKQARQFLRDGALDGALDLGPAEVLVRTDYSSVRVGTEKMTVSQARMNEAMPAIGVFDSGVGGMTVLKALRERWPAENFLYLADTARLPYGNKSLHTVHNYLEQCLAFLKKHPLKAVVVACNTASTALLEQAVPFDVPLFNVVQPGARKAVDLSESKRIGVLGTRATVFSEAYVKAIRQISPEAEVFQQACPLFVPLVEEGWIDDPVTNLIVYRYVSRVLRHQVDTLIFGCTHYPVLTTAIRKAAGDSIQLVDSSLGLLEDLGRLDLKKEGPRGRMRIICTDFSPRLEETAHLILGDGQFDSIEAVDL